MMPKPPQYSDPDPLDADAERAAWGAVDLSAYLGGEVPIRKPELLERSDGQRLLYRGTVHDLVGESESGKSWLIAEALARTIAAGDHAAYIDYETDPGTTVARLLALGAHPDDIARYFRYVQPDEPLMSVTDAALDELLAFRPVFVGIDTVTDALDAHSLHPNDAADVNRYQRLLPRRLAREAGACVVQVDHVVKDTDKRSRYATGSERKLSGGQVVLQFRRGTPPSPGRIGYAEIHISKDRHGQLRKIAQGDALARVVLRSDADDAMTVTLDPPKPMPVDAVTGEARPTLLMLNLWRFIAANPGCSARDFGDVEQFKSRARRETKNLARDLLERDGHIRIEKDGRKQAHYVVDPATPYDPATDPKAVAP